MPLFRKKPVTIEARQFDGGLDTARELANWCNGGVGATGPGQPAINIYTLEGTMQALPGDWIIKGVKGEFYPIKDDIFRSTYEAVEE